WGAHGLENTIGAKVIPELNRFARLQIPKEFNDAFFRSQLNAVLRRLRITDILLCGIQTNYCVRSTAEAAYYRGFKVHVVADCVADESNEFHRIGLRTIAAMAGRVVGSEQCWKSRI